MSSLQTIVLRAEPAIGNYSGEAPKGLVVTRHQMEHNGEPYHFNTFRFPEAGAPRYFTAEQVAAGLVLPIAGRTWRVQVNIEDDEYGGTPEDATVVFIPTSEPETQSKAWDEAESLRKQRADMVSRIAHFKEALQEEQDERQRQYFERDIKREEEEVALIDSGETRLQHPFYAQAFGQPTFIQGEVFPVHNGNSAMNLITLETGWGDCGNINLLFNVDENGLPCALWLEASCA